MIARPSLPAPLPQTSQGGEKIGFISDQPEDFLPSRARSAKNPGRRSKAPSRRVRGTTPRLWHRESWGQRSSIFRPIPAIASNNRPIRPATSSWAIPASIPPVPVRGKLALAGYKFSDASRWPEIRGCRATRWPKAGEIPPVARSGHPLRDAKWNPRGERRRGGWYRPRSPALPFVDARSELVPVVLPNPGLQAVSRKCRSTHSERRPGRDLLFQIIVQRAFQHRPQRGAMSRGVTLGFLEQAVVQFDSGFHAIHPYFAVLADGYFNMAHGNRTMRESDHA